MLSLNAEDISVDVWTILVVDDDPSIHAMTDAVLKDWVFNGVPLQLLYAYSATQAKEIMKKHSDIAVLLLDVVMESEDAGLTFVHYVRNELKNHKTRIVLRTGHLGPSPEQNVMERYDINDYREKAELIPQKLIILMYSSLRSYRDILRVDAKRLAAEKYYAMEELMIQSEKLATIGGLTAGMAHEIQNPLGIITQNIQNIANRLDLTAMKNQQVAKEIGLDLNTMQRYLEERSILKFSDNIKESVDKALKTINDMLNFVRSSDYKKDCFPLQEVLNKAMDFVHKDLDLKNHIDLLAHPIQFDIPAELPVIYGMRTQLVQVFLNLLKNAAQAIDSNIQMPYISVCAVVKDNYLQVDVIDNGKGMAPDFVENIFKPRYTLKEVEKKGLSLSVCHYIINDIHHGKIHVKSSPHHGSTFSVILPLTLPIK